MKHAIVEKRIAGIIRWLERLNKSYSTGEMESALMEAECAKADLETLRRDVWEKIQPRDIRRRRFMPGLMAVLRPAFLAAVILLFAVAPVARDIPAPVMPVMIEETVSEAVPAEPLIAEPVAVVQDAAGEQEQVQEAPVIAAKPEASQARRQQTRKIASVRKPVPAAKTEQPGQKISKTVAYDKVFSLMQTGQRALKNNTSVIKVQ